MNAPQVFMKEQEDINQIITNLLSGTYTEQQKKEVQEWAGKSKVNAYQLDQLQKYWQERASDRKLINHDSVKSGIWHSFQNDQVKQRKPARKYISCHQFWRVAAIIVLLIVPTILLVHQKDFNNAVTEVIAENIVIKENPSGQKSKIYLPDGSTVSLNAGSSIQFIEGFTDSIRWIRLSGEAFFDVAKNPDVPFVVYTNDLAITAMGTSFNVSAFTHKEVQEIALSTGKVKIECQDADQAKCTPSYLKPGDLATFSNQTGRINLSKFRGSDPFCWIDGRIVFHGATFDEVIDVLGRWYNVEFEVEGVLKQEWNYSTSIENEVLENVLKNLEFSENIECELNGSVVKIKLY